MNSTLEDMGVPESLASADLDSFGCVLMSGTLGHMVVLVLFVF